MSKLHPTAYWTEPEISQGLSQTDPIIIGLPAGLVDRSVVNAASSNEAEIELGIQSAKKRLKKVLVPACGMDNARSVSTPCPVVLFHACIAAATGNC